ncbi:MAG: hypothetical protein BGO26_13120 [Actinobacteria bacterium 69-20]|nr:ATP-binding protein [Actinomycetota bacterium]OJV23615.1 MAG: hypothetical protein BGO26_13120 [Actinobacteria bacterium 69-20]
MDPVLNPYNPGAGRRPRALVGRDGELELMDTLIARTSRGMDGRGVILTGLRGVGKTVLLHAMADRAEAAEWFTVRLEARRSVSETFEFQLARALRDAYRASSWRHNLTDRARAAFGTIQSFTAKVDTSGGISASIEFAPHHGRADSSDFETNLLDVAIDLTDAATERRVGVALFIDELQDAPTPILQALTHAVHQAGQTARPFYVIGAGLPSVIRLLSEATSYAERLYDYRPISQLSTGDSGEVLEAPARTENVTWDPEAVSLLVSESAGYPYFLQEFGSAAWDIAARPDAISRSDALAAVNAGRRALDDGFFRARWDRATKAERNYLIAMSSDGAGPSFTGEIASRLGKEPSQLGPARANLISKGLIYAPEHGQISYTVPGMADFIRRQVDSCVP